MTEQPIHEAARAGFQAGADAYERGRPDYPRAAIERLIRELGLESPSVGPGPHLIVDLGAGTGKFTRLLAQATSARILAIEPVPAMREKISTSGIPNVEIAEGTAESISLPDGAADAVFAAQAFHWFDGIRALREIRRVLKPGGGVGLLWNRRDESLEWTAKLTALIDPHEKGAPRYGTGKWREAFDERAPGTPGARFTPLQHAEFRHSQEVPSETLVDRISSISFISALPRAAHERVCDQVRDLLASEPATRGKDRIQLAYVTDIYWCNAIDPTT